DQIDQRPRCHDDHSCSLDHLLFDNRTSRIGRLECLVAGDVGQDLVVVPRAFTCTSRRSCTISPSSRRPPLREKKSFTGCLRICSATFSGASVPAAFTAFK